MIDIINEVLINLEIQKYISLLKEIFLLDFD